MLKGVYVYFDNDQEAFAAKNALELKRREQEVTTRKAEIARSKANLALIDTQLADTVVASPVDGVCAEVTTTAYVPSVRIIHYGGDAAGKGWRHIAYFVRSGLRFYRKHGWKWV